MPDTVTDATAVAPSRAISIAKDGIKRSLPYPFEILVDRASARHLACELRKGLHSTYGWVCVCANHAAQTGPSHEASAWTSPSPVRSAVGERPEPAGIAIRKDGIARMLAVPFDLCLSRATADQLRLHLNRIGQTEAEPSWIEIPDPEAPSRDVPDPEVSPWC
jgi:hypothetical protein